MHDAALAAGEYNQFVGYTLLQRMAGPHSSGETIPTTPAKYMKNKFCITFAGAVGSSKTPIAYYLSQKFNLPIINNDSIRTEVTEDLLEFNQEEYERRRNDRAKDMLERGVSFIFDASVDREWDKLHEWLTEYDYQWFIISLDYSRELLERIYHAKGYDEALGRVGQLINEHESFTSQHDSEISVHLSDKDFETRLEVASQAVGDWLNE